MCKRIDLLELACGGNWWAPISSWWCCCCCCLALFYFNLLSWGSSIAFCFLGSIWLSFQCLVSNRWGEDKRCFLLNVDFVYIGERDGRRCYDCCSVIGIYLLFGEKAGKLRLKLEHSFRDKISCTGDESKNASLWEEKWNIWFRGVALKCTTSIYGLEMKSCLHACKLQYYMWSGVIYLSHFHPYSNQEWPWCCEKNDRKMKHWVMFVLDYLICLLLTHLSVCATSSSHIFAALVFLSSGYPILFQVLTASFIG